MHFDKYFFVNFCNKLLIKNLNYLNLTAEFFILNAPKFFFSMSPVYI